MRMRGTSDLLFVTISHNVSFMGKTWWVLMLVLRLLVVLLTGFTLFSDEQERFICNTIQPGCSNVCFDVFAPVSVLRLWFLHLVLLCLPHVLFAAHVLHKHWSHPDFGSSCGDRSGGGSFENSSSSREASLHKVPLHDLQRPRFYCAYFLALTLQIVLEMVFSAGQFLLFGLSFPKSFHCFEAPCTSGVECYISRPTEKTLMLNFMLGVSALSVLLSVVDLLSSMKAMVRWKRKRQILMEEMSKGEQSSVFTTTTTTEDGDGLPTKRTSPGGGSADTVKDGDLLLTKVGIGPSRRTSVSASEKNQESKEGKVTSPSPLPTPFVLHSHLRPPLYPRPDRGPPPLPPAPPLGSRTATPMSVRKLPGQSSLVGTNSPSDDGESPDKRAWV